MYSQSLGEAYNYGQPQGSNSPTRFIDYQINNSGLPRRRRQNPGAPTSTGAAVPPPTGFQPATEGMQHPNGGQPSYGTPFMPNGQPMPQQRQQPQPLQAGSPQLGQQGSVNGSNVYTAGQAPNYVYNPQQVAQFAQPTARGMENQQAGNLMQMLQSGGSMNPQVVAAMQGQLADQSALLQQQQQGQIRANGASRGIGDSRFIGGQQRQAGSDANSELLNQYRNLAIQAAQTNQSDQLNNLGAADSFQNGLLNRAISGYNTTLAGQGQQRTEQQAFLDSMMQRYGMQEGMLQNQAQSAQGANAQSMQQNQMNQQGGQFDANLELQYRQQQQNEQNMWLNYLTSGIGA